MLIRGDARTLPLQDACVQCVVTSPPYFGLRSYPDYRQIGLEASPDCQRRGLFRLRADLTEDQRSFVLQRLRDAGLF